MPTTLPFSTPSLRVRASAKIADPHAEEVAALLSLDPFGFDAGDPNLYRYVGNSPTNKTDPSGLLELDGRKVGYIQKAGVPAYEINWAVKVDDKKPAGATQVWIITKIESWSVYKKPGEKWEVWPEEAKYNVVYRGDFVDIGNRKIIGDTSRMAFDPKHKYEWAIYFEKVTKTLGYNPAGGAEKQAANVKLSEEQAKGFLKKMRNSTDDLYGYTYLYVNKANRTACGIKIDDKMPEDMRKELKDFMRITKNYKKPDDFTDATGFYLYSPWIPAPQLRYEQLAK